MKNIFKIIILLSILLLVFACPKKESTKPPTVYPNTIDVRFAGSWDLYSCSESNGTKYFYPVLTQKNYMVVSQDSLIINSQLIGGEENHGIFFTEGQIGFTDKTDNKMFLYDYYYNEELNRMWMKADTSAVANLTFDPALNPPDSTTNVNDYYLLYPSEYPPKVNLTVPKNYSNIGDLTPKLEWDDYMNAEDYCVQVSTDSTFADTTAYLVNETVTHSFYTIPNSLPNFSDFYWRVKANNSLWSDTFKFSTFYIVTLLQPANAASVSRKPTIKWAAYENASNYTIQISTVPDFSSVELEQTLEQTQYIPTNLLDAQKRYYWRVKADNSQGNWSLVSSFITDAFVLLQAPENGHTGQDPTSVEFAWQDIENASTYHLQVAESVNENDELIDIVADIDNITATSYTLENQLEVNKTYYWRVSSDVAGKWSYVFNFVTNNSVFLRYPEDNATNISIIVNFQWDRLSENDSLYTIQIATDSLFTTYTEKTTTETSKMISDFLEGSTQYYWRVKADQGAWSDIWSFNTAAIVNGTFINSPADGEEDVSQKVKIIWGEVTNSTYYQVQISESENFETTVLDTVISSNNAFYKLDYPLQFNHTYYCKVRSDITLWSSAKSFTTEDGIPTNFIVEAASPLKFDISWNNTASAPIGYQLERWDSENNDWETIADTIDLNENKNNTYIDFDKNPELFYKYRIKAVSKNGDSDYAVYPEEGEGVQPMGLDSTIEMPEMVNVTAGSFEMGSTSGDADESPVHQVTLTNDFMISKYEISISQFVEVLNYALGKGYIKYDAQYTGDYYTESYCNYASNAISIKSLFVDSTPITFDLDLHKFTYTDDNANKPIYNISYFAAVLYCYSLNEIEENSGFYTIGTSVSSTPYEGSGYRLPTEAEWEYVAKYNDGRTYPWGEEEPTQERANYYGSGWGNEPINVTECSNGANALGVYNMAGNVWEWCNDTYADYTDESQTNPIGPSGSTGTNTYKIMRGGSCELGPEYLRTTNRAYCKANLDPGKVNTAIGFRIVKLP